jgi:EAL domain-containing protein (putative c-di-GMP-specific phosphodiesterase class I)/CheY-like chemotaxis protein
MKDFSASSALIVEDSTVQSEHAVRLLREIGFGTVLAASDGISALRVLEQRGAPVDLVLTDLDMPGMDGLELIQQLSKRRWAANLIAISASQQRLHDAAPVGPQGGVVRVLATIAKPLRLEALQALLHGASMQSLSELDSSGATGAVSAAEIEAALAAGEFIPVYLPRLALDSGRLAGISMQGRWRHPRHGLSDIDGLFPALAGNSELAGAIMRALVMQAVADLRDWQGLDLPATRLSISLPDNLLDDLGQLGRLVAGVQAQETRPGDICWEISEAVVAACEPGALHNVARLNLRGFSIGAVHCGRYEAGIREYVCFPLSEMTIDPLFVQGAAQRSHRRPLLEAVLRMAEKLGIPACADGIAHADDWALLRELGCRTGQGPLVAGPMTGAQLIAWLKDGRMRFRGVAPPAEGTA